MNINIHVHSVIDTRQSKATTPEDNSSFPKRKRRAASGGIQTRDVLHTKATEAAQLGSLSLQSLCKAKGISLLTDRMYMSNQSQRQGKARQPHMKTAIFHKEERDASGGI